MSSRSLQNNLSLDKLNVNKLHVAQSGINRQERNYNKMVGYYKTDPNENNLQFEPFVITSINSDKTTISIYYTTSDYTERLNPNKQDIQKEFNIIGHNYLQMTRVFDEPDYINDNIQFGKHVMAVNHFFFNDNYTEFRTFTEYFGVDIESEEQKIPGFKNLLETNGYTITGNSVRTRIFIRQKISEEEVQNILNN